MKQWLFLIYFFPPKRTLFSTFSILFSISEIFLSFPYRGQFALYRECNKAGPWANARKIACRPSKLTLGGARRVCRFWGKLGDSNTVLSSISMKKQNKQTNSGPLKKLWGSSKIWHKRVQMTLSNFCLLQPLALYLISRLCQMAAMLYPSTQIFHVMYSLSRPADGMGSACTQDFLKDAFTSQHFKFLVACTRANIPMSCKATK